MRIPTGNFGNVIAQPAQQALVPQDNQVTSALGRLGQEMQVVAEQKQRSQAVSVLATMENDAHDLHDEITRGLTDGSVKPEDALSTYQKRWGELKQQRTEGLMPGQIEVIDNHLIKTSGAVERGIKGAIIKRTQQDVGSNLTDLNEQLQRSAMRDLPGSIETWDKLVDIWGPQAGLDPTHMATMKQKFKEGATYNFANATLEGAAQSGNLDLVRAARQKIEGQDGEPIDPAKRTALITKAYGYENGILAANQREAERAAREQDARENAAVDMYNKAFDLSSQGRYFSMDFINELSTAASGTKMAGPVQELVKSQAQVAGFASMSLPQQRATLERMTAAGSTPEIGVNPLEQKVADQMKKIHEASVQAYKENPWQAAQERGVIKDAPTFNVANIPQAQQVLAERMKSIGQIEVAAGRKVSPLQPQEAEQIGRMVRALPPDQQSSALATFGQLVSDGDRLVDLARQFDAKDKVLGTAMMLSSDRTTAGRYVSELLLKGDRALRDKSITVDTHQESGWRGAIATEIRGAYPSDEVAQRMMDAAYFVQAGLTSEGSGDVKRAVRLVTGGIIEHNGGKIPLPRGMDESAFEKRINAIKPENINAPGGQVFVGKAAVPVDQFIKTLPNAALEHAGQGKYVVKAGMGYVTKADGSKLVIEVRQ